MIPKSKWHQAVAFLGSRCPDQDVKFLTDAVASMRRKEASSLLSWTQAWLTLQRTCARHGIVYPAAHWATQFIGQISPRELQVGQFQMPKDRKSLGAFSIALFESEVKALTPGTAPVFHVADVRAWTKTERAE